MLFWIICTIIVFSVTALVLRPMFTSHGGDTENPDVALYRDQLTEIERDLTRGTLGVSEAERTKTEIARRLLAADKSGRTQTGDAPAGVTRMVAGAMAALILLAAGAIYWQLGVPGYNDLPLKSRLATSEQARKTRPSQAKMVAQLPPAPAINAAPDYVDMVEKLRAVTAARPDDLRGQGFLARNEANLGNFAAAITAQQNVIRLRGNGGTLADRMLLLDLMVYQVQGYVSPEAEAMARALLDDDPQNPTAQYYIGLLYDQTDRPDLAFRIWRDMVEGNSTAPHVQMARDFIMQAAGRAGVDYTLPAPTNMPGPSAQDMDAAQDMTAEDRQAMIRGMVEGLNERLATQGGTAEEWARLIGALGVLGETSRAAAIWGEAQQRFAAQPDALTIIQQAATRAGVAE